ncbi:MAG: bifunctional ornithine acetyltransferase/N-acetylglutamate synthase [Chloroflexi bacterium AL-W]|nr:bifunctional ornithine acetyltransferase/N-acetylglutamate synthase [Chloroflexi bacterium AL-N1]NOK67816.1 bifunctional ornithine acetyltransferase/N-acetylglutamate synthase [Chloroflexi bacterium AL-N10]NOK75414.1 bifunctional ornithine acetyltransferase/N-acetylglutamate synthase [Chloroflexi bacterium AL-N5]NOK82202.1 bifunctional ornithine acetyltransferase/N-acetylglutamate synthase [Chloroflexi bacterium AL-W]NOK90047.1 bifunctional ornithine acetyltransferase/N-acetylglutamate synth
MSYRIIEDGHISTPIGYRSTGVSCGLKEVRARDLALVYSTQPAHAAALFTTNAIPAAPIFFNQAVLSHNNSALRAVLINAGQANAGIGPKGLSDAVECAKMVAEELEVPRDSVLLLSTGKIGVPLSMDRIHGGIRRAASELDSGGGRRAANAILTTDTRPKDRAVSASLGNGRSFCIAGMAKGSRMINPRFATLLAVLTTDAAIDVSLLSHSLEKSVERSFGRLSIDSDTSPNDGIIILANGMAECPPIVDPQSAEYRVWQEALDAICFDLSQQVLRDAVANGKVIAINVRGAASEADARTVAVALANSTSVRWACAHAVADWGGLLVAIGASGVALRPDLLELQFAHVPVMLEGVPTAYEPSALVQSLSGSEVEIYVDLHVGTHSATTWTCTTTGESPV